MNREERKKKNKRLGWILTGSVHVILIALLFAFRVSLPEPPPEPALVLDFTGSSSAGGSSANASNTENTEQGENNPVDPVETQDKKSPVKSSNKKKGGESSSSSNNNPDPSPNPNPNASAAGAFSGNGTGQSDGNGNGNNPGIGDGENGPGLTGKIGKLTSSAGTPPPVINPTQDQYGKVVIEITVDRKGKVVDVKVLSRHSQTTTTDPILQNQAKKDGYQWKFKADSKRAELSKGLRIINYTLR